MKTCTSGSRRTSSMVTAIYLTSKPERDSSGSASATSTRLTRAAAAHVPGPPAQPQALALPASARPVVHAVHRPAHADRDRLHHGDLLLAGSSDRERDLWRPGRGLAAATCPAAPALARGLVAHQRHEAAARVAPLAELVADALDHRQHLVAMRVPERDHKATAVHQLAQQRRRPRRRRGHEDGVE